MNTKMLLFSAFLRIFTVLCFSFFDLRGQTCFAVTKVQSWKQYFQFRVTLFWNPARVVCSNKIIIMASYHTLKKMFGVKSDIKSLKRVSLAGGEKINGCFSPFIILLKTKFYNVPVIHLL
jgi:hypothetical protein